MDRLGWQTVTGEWGKQREKVKIVFTSGGACASKLELCGEWYKDLFQERATALWLSTKSHMGKTRKGNDAVLRYWLIIRR